MPRGKAIPPHVKTPIDVPMATASEPGPGFTPSAPCCHQCGDTRKLRPVVIRHEGKRYGFHLCKACREIQNIWQHGYDREKPVVESWSNGPDYSRPIFNSRDPAFRPVLNADVPSQKAD